MNNSEILEELKARLKLYKKSTDVQFTFTKSDIQAIENLIKENKEWKKYATEEVEEEITELNNKNCELEFKIEHLIQENKELKTKLQEHICIEAHEQVKQLYVPKSKIKDKIEEKIKEGNYRTIDNPSGRIHFQKEITDYQIEVLQELLEEGE